MVSKKMQFLRILCWVLFIAWSVFSFTLSQQDGVSSEQVSIRATRITERILSILGIDPNIPGLYMKLRKLAHFLVHFILAMLACFAFATSVRKLSKAAIMAFLTAAAIAVVDELIQISATGRVFATRDILINLTGVTLGIIFATGTARIIKAIFEPN